MSSLEVSVNKLTKFEIKEGLFHSVSKNSFYLEKIKILILDRKNQTEKKTSKYLLAMTKTTKDTKDTYVSSLYPTDRENIFRFDYQQILFELEFIHSKSIVQIRRIS